MKKDSFEVSTVAGVIIFTLCIILMALADNL